jgi:hypothetical protein
LLSHVFDMLTLLFELRNNKQQFDYRVSRSWNNRLLMDYGGDATIEVRNE